MDSQQNSSKPEMGNGGGDPLGDLYGDLFGLLTRPPVNVNNVMPGFWDILRSVLRHHDSTTEITGGVGFDSHYTTTTPIEEVFMGRNAGASELQSADQSETCMPLCPEPEPSFGQNPAQMVNRDTSPMPPQQKPLSHYVEESKNEKNLQSRSTSPAPPQQVLRQVGFGSESTPMHELMKSIISEQSQSQQPPSSSSFLQAPLLSHESPAVQIYGEGSPLRQSYSSESLFSSLSIKDEDEDVQDKVEKCNHNDNTGVPRTLASSPTLHHSAEQMNKMNSELPKSRGLGLPGFPKKPTKAGMEMEHVHEMKTSKSMGSNNTSQMPSDHSHSHSQILGLLGLDYLRPMYQTVGPISRPASANTSFPTQSPTMHTIPQMSENYVETNDDDWLWDNLESLSQPASQYGNGTETNAANSGGIFSKNFLDNLAKAVSDAFADDNEKSSMDRQRMSGGDYANNNY